MTEESAKRGEALGWNKIGDKIAETRGVAREEEAEERGERVGFHR